MNSYCTEQFAKKYAETKMHEQFDKFNLKRFMNFPKVTWKAEGFRTAGYAIFDDNEITLNTNFLYSKSWKEFLDVTPLHELAHLVAFKVDKSKGHDRAWKNVCHAFGLKGERCHTYSLPENDTRKHKAVEYYTVYCPCMEHNLSRTRYKRMLDGVVYSCTECHNKLTFEKPANFNLIKEEKKNEAC